MSATDPSTATRKGLPVRGLVIGGLVIILIVGLAYSVLGLGRSSIPATADVPPVGEIWFGRSFDPTTLQVSGRTSTFGLGAPVAMVAHLSRSISAGQAKTRLSRNGTTIALQPITTLQGTGEIVGFKTSPILMPGSYRYEITDLGGNDLASGSFTATQ